MEPVSGGYRLDRSRVTDQAERADRRRNATYYTPADVASAMVAELYETAGSTASVLDPCCGTGIYLREWIRVIRRNSGRDPELGSLHAVDLDPRSLDVAATVIAHELQLPREAWREVRARFRLGNSLQMASAGNLGRYSAVIGNPPYGRGPDGRDRAAQFVHLLAETLQDGGSGALIVPASIATASTGEMVDARSALIRLGAVTFLNYDRSPDSIFGDDIKQRVSIVLVRRSVDSLVRTSSMLRWRRGARGAALSPRRTVELSGWQGRQPIPTVGSDLEANVIRTLANRVRRKRVSGQHRVAVASTAYNWISAEPMTPEVPGGRHVIESPDHQNAMAFYAAVVSDVSFWIWRSIGDSFHVSRSFLETVASLVERLSPAQVAHLAAAGESLWQSATETTRVAVNRGVRTTANVPSATSAPAMSAANVILMEALGLSHPEQSAFVDTVLKVSRHAMGDPERST